MCLGDHDPKIVKIMIVDDEPYNIMGMKIILQQFGYEKIDKIIDTAHNGAEAVKLVKKSYMEKIQRYGLIFMDLSMPIMDGYEATDQIRAFLKSKKM